MTKRLTEKSIERATRPKIVYDAGATGLGLKVTPAGRKIWILQLRFPGQKAQSRRTLGQYPGISLAEARAKAERWYQLVRQGIDPEQAEADARAQVEAARRAEALKRKNTVASVAERFISEHIAGQRRADAGARDR